MLQNCHSLPYTYHVCVVGGILLVDLLRPAEVEPDVAVVAGLVLRRGPDPVQPSQEVPRLNDLLSNIHVP